MNLDFIVEKDEKLKFVQVAQIEKQVRNNRKNEKTFIERWKEVEALLKVK